MLRFVVFIRTVLVILPGKNNKRIARFQYGLLFVEVMDKFSFRYDENFNIITMRVVERCSASPNMKRKVFFCLKHSRSFCLFYIRKKVVRRHFRELAFSQYCNGSRQAFLLVIVLYVLHDPIVPPNEKQVKRKSKK